MNFLENSLLDPSSGSFFERAILSTGKVDANRLPHIAVSLFCSHNARVAEKSNSRRAPSPPGPRGIYLGVWEPLSLVFKMGLVRLSQALGRPRAGSPALTAVAEAAAASGRAPASGAGLDPQVFVAAATALHGLNAALLALVVVRLAPFLTPGRAGTTTKASAGWKLGAAIGAAAWGVHPLRVEVVCWLSCLPYLLATAATFACLLAYVPLLSTAPAPAAATATSTAATTATLLGMEVWRVALVTTLYGLAVLSKAAALPVLGLLLVLQLFFARWQQPPAPPGTPPAGARTGGSGGGRSSKGKSSADVPAAAVGSRAWLVALGRGACWPAVARVGPSVGVFLVGASLALWANHVGMEVSLEHPQNALKVPRHIDTSGFALTLPADEPGQSTGDGGGGEGAAPAPPPGLMSADWWWSRPALHRAMKGSYSLGW